MRIGILVTGASQMYTARLLSSLLGQRGDDCVLLLDANVLPDLTASNEQSFSDIVRLPPRERFKLKLGRTIVARWQRFGSLSKRRTRKAVEGYLKLLSGGDSSRVTSDVDVLCVVTRCARPEIAWSFSGPVISFLESWDHPYKRHEYFDTLAVSWNQPIADKWQDLQESPAISAGFPLKLSYALNAWEPQMVSQSARNPTWMYAMTLSSRYHDHDAFVEEIGFIDRLHDHLRQREVTLVVKAKPNQSLEELKEYEQLRDIRILDEGRDGIVGDYYLSDDYNEIRRSQLATIDGVIALGTTFLFDAAISGTRVIYLDASQSQEYPALARMTNSSRHINDFLNSVGMPHQSLDQWWAEQGAIAAEMTEVGMQSTVALRHWLTDGKLENLEEVTSQQSIALAIYKAANASSQKDKRAETEEAQS